MAGVMRLKWNANTGMPRWRDANDICTLSDGDRHLGHIVNTGGQIVDTGEWHAFDAIHADDAVGGFRRLGIFPTADQAKAAVEGSVGQSVEDVMDVMAEPVASGFWIS